VKERPFSRRKAFEKPGRRRSEPDLRSGKVTRRNSSALFEPFCQRKEAPTVRSTKVKDYGCRATQAESFEEKS
jgi:hypothetical protein